ncbi:MAG: response regulator [Arenicella sp.]|nr:response regulator [Arenicella sp.]
MKHINKEINVTQLDVRTIILLAQFVRFAVREGADMCMQQADIVRTVFKYASTTDNLNLITLFERIEASLIDQLDKFDIYSEFGLIKTLLSECKPSVNALIVDDSEVVRKALGMLLAKRNINVTTASDGQQALKMIDEKRHFDVVFLDIVMPEVDGYKVCKALKKAPHMNDTKVAMLTSRTSKFNRVRASLVGSDYYLTKPVAQNDLLEFIDDFLRERFETKISKRQSPI